MRTIGDHIHEAFIHFNADLNELTSEISEKLSNPVYIAQISNGGVRLMVYSYIGLILELQGGLFKERSSIKFKVESFKQSAITAKDLVRKIAFFRINDTIPTLNYFYNRTSQGLFLIMGNALAKSVYLDSAEKRLCKIASAQMDIKLKEFYNNAIRWFFDQYQMFPYLFANKENATVSTVWLTEENAKILDEINVPAAHFMHTAIVLYLEVNGFLEGQMRVDWPGKSI